MDLKKEFLQRKIKQETENEPYSSISETFATSNTLQIKFEDTTYTSNEPEDQIEIELEAIINGDHIEESNQLKECKTVHLTKTLDVELISNPQICRLCAQPITSTEIFLYEDGDLEQKINYALPITMGLGDGLPEYICRNCEINLNMFYEFVCQVVNADKAIRARINPPDIKSNDVTSAVIKEIFGSEEEFEEEADEGGLDLQDDRLLEEQINENCLQDNQLLEAETNEGCIQDNHLFEEETNECDLQDGQLFEEETNEGSLQDGRLLEEADTKHLPDLKIKINDKKPSKHLIQDDDSFRPQKIQKVSISDLLVQEKHNVSVEKYKCQLCENFFSDYFTLADHNKEQHEKVRYSCPETDCSVIFTTQKSLRQHIVDNHNVPVICCKCGKIFAHQGALQKHQDNFHFFKVCDNCGMLFQSLLSFKTHRLLHAEVTEFQCVYCYKIFKNRHKLHRHTRQSHSGNFTLLVDMKEDEIKKN